jgi:transposase
VPTPAEEAARDLVRAREEVKADRRVARQRIRSFLLRYGKRYPRPNDRWSFRFEVWMRALRFDEPAAHTAIRTELPPVDDCCPERASGPHPAR